MCREGDIMELQNTSLQTPWPIETIWKVLPHRFPFLLVDRVEEVTESLEPGSRVGRRVKAIKNVSINEPFFTGHFPHRPVMPGVLIIEALAQASAMAAFNPLEPQNDVAIVSVDNAKFRRPVVPGDRLELHSVLLKEKRTMLFFDCKAIVDGHVVAQAEIMANVIPMPRLNN
jgi:3-hydroxyacyl-[acyl-carrier-protein] dehydratase